MPCEPTVVYTSVSCPTYRSVGTAEAARHQPDAPFLEAPSGKRKRGHGAPRFRPTPTLGSGFAVHSCGLWQKVPGYRRTAVDGFNRGLLRQRPVRELLCHPAVWTAWSADIPDAPGSKARSVRVHRRLVQPSSQALGAGVRLTGRLRKKTCGFSLGAGTWGSAGSRWSRACRCTRRRRVTH